MIIPDSAVSLLVIYLGEVNVQICKTMFSTLYYITMCNNKKLRKKSSLSIKGHFNTNILIFEICLQNYSSMFVRTKIWKKSWIFINNGVVQWSVVNPKYAALCRYSKRWIGAISIDLGGCLWYIIKWEKQEAYNELMITYLF